jgi:hypothetical protein
MRASVGGANAMCVFARGAFGEPPIFRASVVTAPPHTGDTTMTKIALAAAVLFGSASLALAQTALPQYDGDGNQIRGAYQSAVRQAPADFENAFAASRVQAPAGQLDGDGNVVPGAH